VPRGTVKSLRLFTYHFGYQRVAGIDHRVGSNGPWEVKRVLGTVPVEGDGSALFQIPARTPISVQPLDAEGKALALMRSWMTAMPGENLSCVGCHERQNSSPTPRQTLALKGKPREITPWHGPLHGFSFARDVQPMLDRYCIACHGRATPENGQIDLRADQGGFVVYEHGNPQLKRVDGQPREQLVGKYSGVFEPSYAALRQFVRVGGLESDLHLLPPKEFHADTSELVQMLKKGHHGVRLDAGAWDRLITWIDLNAPCNGTWKETTRIPIAGQPSRRLELRRAYGGIDDDAEAIPAAETRPVEPIRPQPVARPVAAVPSLAGWPLAAATAQARQEAAGPATRSLELGGGLRMEFVRIPAGSFIMGDPQGGEDETPGCAVEIRDSFWMARFEVTNEQYRQFDPRHDSRFEHRTSWIFSDAYVGWPLNQPRQPVVRVSWDEARGFCQWLSARAGVRVNLPTEAQWEYACRAGTATPWHYGGPDADFSAFANLGDASLKRLADEGWRPKAPDLVPRDNRFNDGSLVTAEVGSYRPNAWGLHDLHGNAAEWTRSTLQPYPCAWQAEGPAGEKVVRGGSWRDRPKNCRSSSRLSYPAYQKIYNVGFRVIIEDDQRLLRADRSGATGSR
jgi:formylglycine-generating enzyme required for sulfatase activity